MAYRVELTARAARDLTRLFKTINAEYSKQAANWFNGMESLVLSLEAHPSRGSAVQEDRSMRQVFYGKPPHIYRIIYAIDEPAQAVRVIHIRHGARRKSVTSAQ